jgi:phosphatidylinositol alpha-mannosyltransferase
VRNKKEKKGGRGVPQQMTNERAQHEERRRARHRRTPDVLRIALLHATLPTPVSGRPRDGGVSHVVHELATALARRGHDVRVASLDTPPPAAAYRGVRLADPWGIARSRLGRTWGLPWLILWQGLRGGPATGLWRLPPAAPGAPGAGPEGMPARRTPALPALAGLSAASSVAGAPALPTGPDQPDVVHAHGDDWLLAPALRLYGLAGRPRPALVRTFHGSALAEACAAGTTPARRVNQLLLYLAELVSAASVDAAVAVSPATARLVPQVRADIPPGVDLARFRPGPAEARSAVPAVLVVGTLGGRKRGWLAVRAFQEAVRPRLADAELWLVCPEPVTGPGVVWLGKLAPEALVARYQRAWVVCLPSAYEGFGLPALEALACGTPVVATPTPGAREVLAGGRYGLLVPPAELGQALAALLADPARRAHLAAAGLARAAEYSWERIAARHEALYADVLRRA